ncbi:MULTISPECIES: DUF6527 family protein [Dyadobacter]|uniref:DUF6527 family protein n=1 Tax=Dyadobacter TaxID=120831 RepID=UPI0015F2C7BC|nr:DUF6527 family protein [Dyadobacter psychrotolerans]
MERSVAIHLCACGCGNEVVTPLSPADWQLKYDGAVISLIPSIGNWNFPCQSHYWITNNKIKWAASWNKNQIEDSRDFHYNRRKMLEPENKDAPKVQDESLIIVKKKRWAFWGILRFFKL